MKSTTIMFLGLALLCAYTSCDRSAENQKQAADEGGEYAASLLKQQIELVDTPQNPVVPDDPER